MQQCEVLSSDRQPESYEVRIALHICMGAENPWAQRSMNSAIHSAAATEAKGACGTHRRCQIAEDSAEVA